MSLVPSQAAPSRLSIYRTSLVACRFGISVVPILPDGSKRPACRWRVYQQRRTTLRELMSWFGYRCQGLAFITGTISGGLEALDFDTRESYHAWTERVQETRLTALHERLTEGYLEATPNGIHLLYRCPRLIEGNQKLAKVPGEGPQRWQTFIETRGEGGLVVVAPSGGGVHPSGKPYVLLQGGIATIATITPAERQALFTVARSFDASPPPSAFRPEPIRFSASERLDHRINGARPGDRYNQETSWEEVLGPHGWRLLYDRDGEGYWQRPGKDGPGISATTNYQGRDRLYVFSTSTCFEAGRSYSKFAAYTFLEHGGDFAAAARALAARGSLASRHTSVEHSEWTVLGSICGQCGLLDQGDEIPDMKRFLENVFPGSQLCSHPRVRREDDDLWLQATSNPPLCAQVAQEIYHLARAEQAQVKQQDGGNVCWEQALLTWREENLPADTRRVVVPCELKCPAEQLPNGWLVLDDQNMGDNTNNLSLSLVYARDVAGRVSICYHTCSLLHTLHWRPALLRLSRGILAHGRKNSLLLIVPLLSLRLD